jgi:hypothetical protein
MQGDVQQWRGALHDDGFGRGPDRQGKIQRCPPAHFENDSVEEGFESDGFDSEVVGAGRERADALRPLQVRHDAPAGAGMGSPFSKLCAAKAAPSFGRALPAGLGVQKPALEQLCRKYDPVTAGDH